MELNRFPREMRIFESLKKEKELKAISLISGLDDVALKKLKKSCEECYTGLTILF